MPEAHPIELRERVVRAYESGEGTYAVIGVRFAVGEASVKRWVATPVLRHNSIPRGAACAAARALAGSALRRGVVGRRGVIERITKTRGAVLPDRW